MAHSDCGMGRGLDEWNESKTFFYRSLGSPDQEDTHSPERLSFVHQRNTRRRQLLPIRSCIVWGCRCRFQSFVTFTGKILQDVSAAKPSKVMNQMLLRFDIPFNKTVTLLKLLILPVASVVMGSVLWLFWQTSWFLLVGRQQRLEFAVLWGKPGFYEIKEYMMTCERESWFTPKHFLYRRNLHQIY